MYVQASMDLGPEDIREVSSVQRMLCQGREGGRERERESACALNASLSQLMP